MKDIFINTLNQIIMLFLFMAVGYILRKRNILPEITGSILSKLEIYIFMPAISYKIFSEKFNLENITSKLNLLFISILLLTIIFIAARVLAKLFSKEKLNRNIYAYSLTISNYGYMGYAMVGAVFGDEALLDMMIFTLPFGVFVYTIGIHLLTPDGKWTLKKLLNPTFVLMFLGCIAGIFKIQPPPLVQNTAQSASNCMAPVAMILTGIVLADCAFKKTMSDYKIYIASVLRLLVIPFIIIFTLHLAGISKEIILIAVATYAMPMGLNSIIFPKAFNADSSLGAQLALVSNILGLVTIPVVFAFLANFIR